MRILGSLVWVAGIILAKGFWWTLLAVVFPIYDVYLVAMKIMTTLGWV